MLFFYFILFYFILFYFILFYFILFYFILFYFILFYFILFYFILFYFILFYFILFYFILFYFILFYFILFYFILFYFILFYFIHFVTLQEIQPDTSSFNSYLRLLSRVGPQENVMGEDGAAQEMEQKVEGVVEQMKENGVGWDYQTYYFLLKLNVQFERFPNFQIHKIFIICLSRIHNIFLPQKYQKSRRTHEKNEKRGGGSG